MSVDFTVACRKCKIHHHLGQDFTSGPCFGYSSDDVEGSLRAGHFIAKHVWCKKLEILLTDDIPKDSHEVEMDLSDF